MAAVAVADSLTTGHGSYPPTKLIPSQAKVFVDGKAVIINGDQAIPHGHDPAYCIASQSKLFINGVQAIVIADSLTDTDVVAQGSPKFFTK